MLINKTSSIKQIVACCSAQKPYKMCSFEILKRLHEEEKQTAGDKRHTDIGALESTPPVVFQNKPITFGLSSKYETSQLLQKFSTPSIEDSRPKWKPFGSVSEENDKKSPSPSPEPTMDPELENLRNEALKSMEKAQKDLAYVESLMQQKSREKGQRSKKEGTVSTVQIQKIKQKYRYNLQFSSMTQLLNEGGVEEGELLPEDEEVEKRAPPITVDNEERIDDSVAVTVTTLKKQHRSKKRGLKRKKRESKKKNKDKKRKHKKKQRKIRKSSDEDEEEEAASDLENNDSMSKEKRDLDEEEAVEQRSAFSDEELVLTTSREMKHSFYHSLFHRHGSYFLHIYVILFSQPILETMCRHEPKRKKAKLSSKDKKRHGGRKRKHRRDKKSTKKRGDKKRRGTTKHRSHKKRSRRSSSTSSSLSSSQTSSGDDDGASSPDYDVRSVSASSSTKKRHRRHSSTERDVRRSKSRSAPSDFD
uniref:Uncharacterized protein n=1 Tax=Romanomermis culicivorax TaxID=13658 RepID=A0A915HFQ8_ROMCU